MYREQGSVPRCGSRDKLEKVQTLAHLMTQVAQGGGLERMRRRLEPALVQSDQNVSGYLEIVRGRIGSVPLRILSRTPGTLLKLGFRDLVDSSSNVLVDLIVQRHV